MSLAGLHTGRLSSILHPPYILFSPSSLNSSLTQAAMLMEFAQGFAASVSGVVVFSTLLKLHSHEHKRGVHHVPFFFGVTFAQFFRIFLASLHFSAVYFIVTAPLMPFESFMVIQFLNYGTLYASCYIISMIFPPSNAALLSVILGVLFGTSNGTVAALPVQIRWLSPGFWTANAYWWLEARLFTHFYQLRQVAAPYFGYLVDCVTDFEAATTGQAPTTCITAVNVFSICCLVLLGILIALHFLALTILVHRR